jgi:hypothetical protein
MKTSLFHGIPRFCVCLEWDPKQTEGPSRDLQLTITLSTTSPNQAFVTPETAQDAQPSLITSSNSNSPSVTARIATETGSATTSSSGYATSDKIALGLGIPTTLATIWMCLFQMQMRARL